MRPHRIDIAAEQAEDAAFLAGLRHSAFESHEQSLRTLTTLDARLLAHLDGVVVAESTGWEAAAPYLGSKDPREGFVAAFVATAQPADDPWRELMEALPQAAESRGLRTGLRLARGEAVPARLDTLRRAQDPVLRSFGLDALAFRGERSALEAKDEIAALLRSGAPVAVRNALAVAGRSGNRKHEPMVAEQLAAEDVETKSAALRAGLLLGSGAAQTRAREWAKVPDAVGLHALRWLAMSGGVENVELLLAAAREKKAARVALLTAARLGRPEVADQLVNAAADPALSRVAGFALTRVFGLDLAAEGLVKRETEPAPPQAEGIDRSYLDDGFAEPDAERLRAWWAEHGKTLTSGARLRGGAPLTWSALLAELDDAPLPEREAALLECRLRLPDLPAFESRGWADDQRRARDTFAQAVEAAGRRAPLEAFPTTVATKR